MKTDNMTDKTQAKDGYLQ